MVVGELKVHIEEGIGKVIMGGHVNSFLFRSRLQDDFPSSPVLERFILSIKISFSSQRYSKSRSPPLLNVWMS